MAESPALSLRRLCLAVVSFSTVMLLVAAGLAAFGNHQDGQLGVRAGMVAGGACWVSGVAALAVMVLFRNPQQSVFGVLLGMLFRMFPPLILGLLLMKSQSELLQAGVMGMTVIAYVTGLMVETCLTLWLLGAFTGADTSRMAKAL